MTRTLQERSWESLEWPKLKERLAELATSAVGKELCRNLAPADDETVIIESLQETTECKELLEEEDNLPLAGIGDLREVLERAVKEAVLESKDLIAVGETLRASARLKSFFQQRRGRAPLLCRLTQSLADLDDMAEEISQSFDASGSLSDDASPLLRSLRRQVRLFHQQIKDHLESILTDPSYAQELQDNYYTIRANRYVIPVKAEARSRVAGIVHDSSLSGATVFIEPQRLVERNNQLKMAELEMEREEYRILKELSALVADHAAEISTDLQILARVDLVNSKAQLSRLLKGYAPAVNVRGRVRLLDVRHPLLALTREEVVSNVLCLGRDFQALIITGPNAGGKTITLKTMGLCALMVRAGLHLPAAPDSEMAVFSGIYADIGDQQSIESSLSTFSAHLLNMTEILHNAGPRALVLLDEVATSTDPHEGASLAQAILEQLVDRGALVMATTHYGQLKALPIQDPRFANAGMEFDTTDLRPTYRLELGIPGRSYGMEIARRLGLPAEAYERAKDLLGEERASLDVLLEDLEKKRLALSDEQQLLERLRREAQNLQGEYHERLANLKEEKREILTRSLRDITSLVSTAKGQIETLLEEAKKDRRVEHLREAKQSTARLENQVRTGIQEVMKDLLPPQTPEEKTPLPCRPGEEVEVISLGQKGVLLDDPSQTSRVQVQVGQVKMTVASDNLRPWRARGASSSSPKATGFPRGSTARRDRPESVDEIAVHLPRSENTCDLRGLRVDEALDEAEKYLDQAMLRNLSQVYLIHGHGTGALKASLRRYLETSLYVRRFRPGEPQEGGDGVTMVELGS